MDPYKKPKKPIKESKRSKYDRGSKDKSKLIKARNKAKREKSY